MLVILALGMWKEQKSEASLGYVRLSLVSKAGKGTIQRMKKKAIGKYVSDKGSVLEIH